MVSVVVDLADVHERASATLEGRPLLICTIAPCESCSRVRQTHAAVRVAVHETPSLKDYERSALLFALLENVALGVAHDGLAPASRSVAMVLAAAEQVVKQLGASLAQRRRSPV